MSGQLVIKKLPLLPLQGGGGARGGFSPPRSGLEMNFPLQGGGGARGGFSPPRSALEMG